MDTISHCFRLVNSKKCNEEFFFVCLKVQHANGAKTIEFEEEDEDDDEEN